MTEASEVAVISPERLELAVSSGSHRPPGAGLLRPAPPSLPSPSFHIHACLLELRVHPSLGRHAISLHYTWYPERPRRKHEGCLGQRLPRPTSRWLQPALCLHCAPQAAPGRGPPASAGTAALILPPHPPPASAIPAQTEMQPEALRSHPPVVSPWAPSRTSGCLCSIIILMPDSGLALIPHLQSILTSVRASHLLPRCSNRKQLLCG